MRSSIGIILAMPAEAGALFGRRTARHLKTHKVLVMLLADGLQIVVTCAGVGPENARAAATRLTAKGVSGFISIGLAAGLDSGLNSGHIVVASGIQVHDAHCPQGLCPVDAAGAGSAYTILRENGIAASCGTLLSTSRPILTSHQKKTLFRQTGALAVDMESAAVARVAHQAGVPFIGLRAVCDPAGVTVPRDLSDCLGNDGSISIGTVLYRLACRPALIHNALQMGPAFATARKSLRRAWRILVDNRCFNH
jgi:adenosylhomocysteine nucleosidase